MSKFKLPIFNRVHRRAAISLTMAGLLSACNLGSLPNFGGSSDGDAGLVVDLSKPVVVALLVPTDGAGPLSAVGKSLENSARLAYDSINNNEIDLRVYSTAGNPAIAQRVAQKAQEDGASIIIGPLKSEEVGPVDQVTDVPIFTFSNNSDVAGQNVYVFGTTFENIATRVIDFEHRQGSNNLGIVYQNDVAGVAGAEASKSAAGNTGVQVVATEPYVLTHEDITNSGPRIANNLKQSGADMVMFTDYPNGGGLGLISIALRDNGFTSENAQYMGISMWQDFATELSEAGMNGGIFAVPDPARSARFRTLYNDRFGGDPADIGGLAYDAVFATILLVRDARRTNDNTPFSSRDINGLKFNGALGAVKMEDHKANRALAVMQLNGNSVNIVSNAPGQM